MSVINQMLRDLDARRAAPAADAPAGLVPVGMVPHRRNPRSRRLPVIALAGGVLVAAVGYTDWPGLLAGKANAATAASVPTPAAMSAPPALRAAAAESPGAVASVASDASTLPRGDKRSEPAAARALPAALTPTTATTDPLPAIPAIPAVPAPVAMAAASAALAGTTIPVSPGTIDKKMVSLTAEQRAQAAYRLAVDAANAGHPQVSAERALEALRHEPRHRAARHLAAVLLHSQGAADRAIALALEGLALDPGHAALALLLARLQLEQGSSELALGVLDQYSLHHAEAEGLRAGILAQQGDYKRSLGAYESALRQQPGNATWWLGLGVALESEGQAQQARQSYVKAQALGLERDELSSFVAQRLRALD